MRHFITRRAAKALALGAVATLALAGCGGGSLSGNDSSSSPSASGSAAANGELEQIVVGVIGIAPSAAMQYGVDEGIFEEHGLDVELQTGQGGAAMLPAVSTGDMNFAVGNPLTVMVAKDKGLDMKIVTGYSNSYAEGEDINGVVARADSGITTFADLEGKTASVNAVNTQGDLTIMEAASLAGADPTQIKFSEMPFPDMEAQLDLGNTDAIWIPEPFLSKALSNPDNVLVGYSNQEAVPGMPTMVTFTSGNYASSSPETVEKFKSAMEDLLTQAEANIDDVKAVLPAFMNMPAEVAANLKMEQYDAELRTEELENMGELMVKYNFVEKAPDLGAMTVD
ncbi:ABC transporter substrate-binding protein [Arthrobacter sp. Edens01]|uniref:ABC transporter substrate-binding protein n=1 Tax=Arthrobacter sp. Edens01 TaxID=1732020 RepID=UPI0006DA17B6|nr:ABC transporter substrate-binding protein [Arthrobacter sp. Edens01]KPN16183.1 thiamine biosynthesis protein [Arthrobacter sp. Edens01]